MFNVRCLLTVNKLIWYFLLILIQYSVSLEWTSIFGIFFYESEFSLNASAQPLGDDKWRGKDNDLDINLPEHCAFSDKGLKMTVLYQELMDLPEATTSNN